MEPFKAKHSLFDKEKFAEERAKLGDLILEGMKTTGGTDVDWVVEHRGGFIVMENKTFVNDWISLPVGQMITFEQMYKKLNSDGRCHFLIFGFDHGIDFKNQDSLTWYFDMDDWDNKKICPKRTVRYKKFGVHRREMTPISLKQYRMLMEKYWKEFEKDFLNTKFETHITQKIQEEKKKKYTYEEIRKTHVRAYKKWTETDDKFLKMFWSKKSNQTRDEKIKEIMKKFGRNQGSINSRLNKLGLN